jgi:biotin/methionine sulfoxide reductase
MLPTPNIRQVSTHWGTYVEKEGLEGKTLQPFSGDPNPTSFWKDIEASFSGPERIGKPMVRESFLRRGLASDRSMRGRERFVEVAWDVALDLAAEHIERVRTQHGNRAIYGGSYGWSSAGRFHHAQSQVHRFLNSVGGYTRSVNSYSYGAAEVILPHVVGSLAGLTSDHPSWDKIAEEADLVVAFGGMPAKNAQTSAGGLSAHVFDDHLRKVRQSGTEFVNVGPIRDDVTGISCEWLNIRPNTDTAFMLGLAYVLIDEELFDADFLEKYTVGFTTFSNYVKGLDDGVRKTPDWASKICGIDPRKITSLARRLSRSKSLISMCWALQRGDNGEQPFWMAVTLAAMLGQIGRPGTGFGFGYGLQNSIGRRTSMHKWPALDQKQNPVSDYIPVSRISDMLLHPGAPYRYNGRDLTYPDIKLIYWAGGNPFHHHQDLNRLVKAWTYPEVVIANEAWWNGLARHADIVLPCTLMLERNDIACTSREDTIFASHKLREPHQEARNDYDIFAELARRLGAWDIYTETKEEEDWLREFYAAIKDRACAASGEMPSFEEFWQLGSVEVTPPPETSSIFERFVQDPVRHRLATPSGRIEIFSQTIASFGIVGCPGHPAWVEPSEWLGGPLAQRYPLHLLANQPRTKLHSQYDHSPNSRAAKISDREPLRIHPEDARARGIADKSVVRMFNDRGQCLVSAVYSEEVEPGVVQIATGAWFDPLYQTDGTCLEIHGNPNVLTSDRGTSELAQASSANSCLVEVEQFFGSLPPITCFQAPEIVRETP